MRPREFLTAKGYDEAVLLTWSFDPVFFERVFLRLLQAGGTGRVAVVMDGARHAELQTSLADSIHDGSVRALGLEYALGAAHTKGHFHPKLWVRSSDRGALVWVGSCNLTAFGWSGQWELGAAWAVGHDQDDPGGWLRPILEDVRALCDHAETRTALDRLLARPWLPEVPGERPPVLWSGRETLSSQLTTRWPNDSFPRARMLTGSTDDAGALARWAHKALRCTHFDLAVSLPRCDLNRNLVADLPCELRIAEFDRAPRPLHAKLLWLDGDDGPRAVMGSANFSASAWLRPLTQGGNHELVVVYDDPRPEDFEELLQDFDFAVPAGDVLPEPAEAPKPIDPPPGPRHRIVQAQWNSLSHQLQLQIAPPLPEGAAVTLLGDEPRTLSRDGEAWMLRVRRDPGPWCLRVEIHTGLETHHCTAVVDHTRELRDAAATRRWNVLFDTIRGNPNSNEQRRVIEDLTRLRTALLQPPAPDAPRSTGGGRSEACDSSRPPLDPSRLAGARVVPVGSPVTSTPSMQGGIGGLLRSIFDFEAPETDDQDDPEVDDQDETSTDGDDATWTSEPDARRHSLNDKTIERLIEQMGSFFEDLHTKGLDQQGDPEQVQQAFALPLALALAGLESGWLPTDTAGDWVRRIHGAMLGDGILAASSKRFADDPEQAEQADRLLGDGGLLAAARVALAVVPWTSRLERALSIRRLDEAESLRTDADLQQLQRLLGCVRITPEHRAARDAAFADVGALHQLEKELIGRFEELASRQREAKNAWMRDGEMIFFRNGDWGWVQEESVLKDRAQVRCRRVGDTGDPSKWLVRHKQNSFLIDLSLLARLGVELPDTRGLIDLTERAAGERERAAGRIGQWR